MFSFKIVIAFAMAFSRSSCCCYCCCCCLTGNAHFSHLQLSLSSLKSAALRPQTLPKLNRKNIFPVRSSIHLTITPTLNFYLATIQPVQAMDTLRRIYRDLTRAARRSYQHFLTLGSFDRFLIVTILFCACFALPFILYMYQEPPARVPTSPVTWTIDFSTPYHTINLPADAFDERLLVKLDIGGQSAPPLQADPAIRNKITSTFFTALQDRDPHYWDLVGRHLPTSRQGVGLVLGRPLDGWVDYMAHALVIYDPADPGGHRKPKPISLHHVAVVPQAAQSRLSVHRLVAEGWTVCMRRERSEKEKETVAMPVAVAVDNTDIGGSGMMELVLRNHGIELKARQQAGGEWVLETWAEDHRAPRRLRRILF